MADKTSMLIIVTPDGVSHGQRLTDHEAVELTRRLLELREGDEPEPSPRQNGGRRPGAGRKRINLTAAQAESVLALRREGFGIRSISQRLGLSEVAVARVVKAAESKCAALQKPVQTPTAKSPHRRGESAAPTMGRARTAANKN